jgi:hypothetical protein
MIIGKILSSFILFTGTRHIFTGIDATGFKITHASEYYTSRAKLQRKKYAKLSIDADVLKQIICKVKARRTLTQIREECQKQGKFIKLRPGQRKILQFNPEKVELI